MAFVQRIINVSFILGQGVFIGTTSNMLTLSGLRVRARITKAGGPSKVLAQLGVYGMTLSQMNQLSSLGMRPTLVTKNVVIIEAGDLGGTLSTVFIGTITAAWGEYSAMPEVPFRVEAHSGMFEAIYPVPATSIQGPADVGLLMSGLATLMGVQFENNGVQQTLSNQYLSGSAYDQAQQVVEAAGIRWSGLDNGKITIWPTNGERHGLAPLVSAETGMIGYPSFTSKGIACSSVFLPGLDYGVAVVVKSTLTPANGTWIVYKINHELDSRTPGGQWRSNFEAATPGFAFVA